MLQAHVPLGQPESFSSGDKDFFVCSFFSNQSEDAEIVVQLTAGRMAPNWLCLKSVNRAKSSSSGEAGLPLPSLQRELEEHLQAGHLAQMDEQR